MSAPETSPALAVVGCVNMGKSSIVATLVEDDGILIASEAGSTRRAAAYDLRLGDGIAFTLIDTPGFQNARRALAWIEDWRKQHETEHVSATKAVHAFFEAKAEEASFRHEIRLLAPILEDGAGILYVVDGTQPYLQRYEAEMRILAMTGAPRMGVINLRGDNSPHADAWEEALRPWFKVTRFDAHGADAQDRLRLFSSLRGVDDAWAEVIDRAIQRLRTERAGRHELAAAAVAHLLIDALAMHEEAPAETNRDRQTEELSEKLFDRLREREQACRREIEALYKHHRLKRAEDALSILDADLLDREQWRLLGLSYPQLAAAGTAAGAAAGGVADAALAGLSFPFGTLVGAAVGGLGTVWGASGLARVKVLGTPLGGRALRVEPPPGPEFPFVLLDRALVHWHLVAGRAHARRDTLELEAAETSSVVQTLSASTRRVLARTFEQIRRRGELDDGDRKSLISDLRALAPDHEEAPTP
ncbi:MAG: DUF3482 domain-containing protein [Myxococcota bacterium]